MVWCCSGMCPSLRGKAVASDRWLVARKSGATGGRKGGRGTKQKTGKREVRKVGRMGGRKIV